MVKYLSVLLVIVLTMALVVTGCSPATPTTTTAPTATSSSITPTQAAVKPVELRFSDQNPPTGRISVKYIQPWIKAVEEASEGRIKITLFPGESLHKGTESVAAIAGGITDLTWIPHGLFPGKFPLSEVAKLPFIGAPDSTYEGQAKSAAAINSIILQQLIDTIPEMQQEYKGMKLLYSHTSSPYFLATNKKQVRTMEDLQGLKVRELGGPPTEMWKLLGANPMLVATADCYDAASKGVIDGMALQWSLVGTWRLFEVFKYYSDIGTTMATFSVLMNQGAWDRLSPDLQEVMMSVSGTFGAEFAGTQNFGFELEEEVKAQMGKTDYIMEEIKANDGEAARWEEKAGKPIWDSWVKEMEGKGLPGQKVLDEWLNLVSQYK
jgi:TRAP-type C4-dicarboxylate transport system substrate-binding protein